MEQIKGILSKRKSLVIALDIVIIVAFMVGVGFIDIKDPSDVNTSIIRREWDKEFDNGSKIKIDNLSKEQEQNLFKLCKVWGFVKYYHPVVARGSANWDYELFRVMPKVLEEKDSANVDKILCEWLEKLGSVKEDKNETKSEKVKLEANTEWIKDNKFVSSDLSGLLSKIKAAKRTGTNYYVRKAEGGGNTIFQNERSYGDIDYKNDEGYKLLSLFRYWNMIEYYFPYRTVMDQSWETVLTEFIPKIVKCENELDYNLALYELTAKIQDGHVSVVKEKPSVKTFFGENFAPVEVKKVENKVVVSKKLKDLNSDANIKIGDVIVKIDGKDVNELITEKLKYIPDVNKHSHRKALMDSLIRTSNKELELSIERDNNIVTEKIKCIDYATNIGANQNIDANFVNNGNIAYIYVESLSKGELENLMEEFKNTKGVVLDFRCYPSVDIMPTIKKRLIKDSKVYAKVTEVNEKVPGQFIEKEIKTIDSDNHDAYTGKIIVITDEYTKSNAEYLAMLLKYGANATIVGSNSSGVNGEGSEIILPGGFSSYISWIGIYHPDGTETQRVGITPDVEVKPTIKGLRDGRDELLDKAIYIINH